MSARRLTLTASRVASGAVAGAFVIGAVVGINGARWDGVQPGTGTSSSTSSSTEAGARWDAVLAGARWDGMLAGTNLDGARWD